MDKSIIICNSLLEQGVEPLLILNQLIVLYIEIYFAFSDNHNNLKIGWLNKIIQNNISKYLKKYNQNEIEKLLKVLLEFDKMMKYSSINKKYLIINLLFKIQINYDK